MEDLDIIQDNSNVDSQYMHLLQESPQMIFKLSEKYFLEQDFQQSYTILHLLVYKKIKIPNLHYNLAKLALKLNNEDLAKMHLKEELEHYDNLAALSVLEKLEVNNSIPLLTFLLAFLILIVNLIFFQNLTQLQIFSYALHLDNISIFSMITSFFMHTSFLHLTSNLVLFILLGTFLEKFLSKTQYLIIFFVTGLLSNGIQILISPFNTLVAGISGSIFGFLAVLLFRAPMLSFKIKNINISLLMITLGVYMLSILTFENQVSIAHHSHLFGFLIGAGLSALSSSFLRSRFYPLLIFIFGIMLFSSFLVENYTPLFIFIIIDVLIGMFCIVFSYAFLSKKEEYLRGID